MLPTRLLTIFSSGWKLKAMRKTWRGSRAWFQGQWTLPASRKKALKSKGYADACNGPSHNLQRRMQGANRIRQQVLQTKVTERSEPWALYGVAP